VQRRRIEFSGGVQGRGFRPILYRLAKKNGLSGWVKNARHQLILEIQGEEQRIKSFESEAGHVFSHGVEIVTSSCEVQPQANAFSILPSETGFSALGDLPADLATCPECLNDLRDPLNRRFGYPFLTCAACGPRYTITEAMPYDRMRTTMIDFPLCPACRREYEDEGNRRFHAETISCWDCGPELALWDSAGVLLSRKNEALEQTIYKLKEGKIVAVKGVGGFHLMADARNPSAVRELRQRKARPHKPFAVLFPDLETLEEVAILSPEERRELLSSAGPIVLLRAKAGSPLAEAMVPGGNLIGAFLPSNPLHHEICGKFPGPLIATSGNRKGEPIGFEERVALSQLKGIADFFLVHNRRILHPVDDSIVRWMGDHPTLFRRARGYPQRLAKAEKNDLPFGAGAYLKNTSAWAEKGFLYLSPHLGDMDSPQARAVWTKRFEATQSDKLIVDLHPDYPGARVKTSPKRIQHHKAHVLSGMVDQHLSPPLLGVAWDGTGLGEDGQIWGGEFFIVDKNEIRRIATLLPFPLLGAEKAIRDPRRVALALLWQSGLPTPTGGFGFSPADLDTLRMMFDKKIQSPLCSSAGRLFDGIAAIAGVSTISTYDGHAASLVEAAAGREGSAYPFELQGFFLDWRPMVRAIVEDASIEKICYRFHLTLAEMILAVALQSKQPKVLLTGGCFQNALLTRVTAERLRGRGVTAYWHEHIPPNDGGLSVGQVKAFWEGLCV